VVGVVGFDWFGVCDLAWLGTAAGDACICDDVDLLSISNPLIVELKAV
jgi:hypothetical protein